MKYSPRDSKNRVYLIIGRGKKVVITILDRTYYQSYKTGSKVTASRELSIVT